MFGPRSRRLVWAFGACLWLGALCLAFLDAVRGVWLTRLDVLLLLAGAVLVGILFVVILWHLGDYEVRTAKTHSLRKLLVGLLLIFLAVNALGVLVGFLEGVFSRPSGPAMLSEEASVTAPVYDPDEAVVFVCDRLPQPFRDELDAADVAFILDLEFEYLKRQGLVGDASAAYEESEELVELDEAKMVEFIRSMAGDYGRDYTVEAVEAVLEVELEYMEHIGIAVIEFEETPSPEEPSAEGATAPASPE